MIEARNVIDGYDLIDWVRKRTYPFGIDGLPTEQAKANAIQAEIVRLEETLDAISDLMMAESVHQAVQSNIDLRGARSVPSSTERCRQYRKWCKRPAAGAYSRSASH